MLLALAATTLVLLVLLWQLAQTPLRGALARVALAWRMTVGPGAQVSDGCEDPGRERRAEQRARRLLRSCVNEEEWDMYRELGFLRVWGSDVVPGSDGIPAVSDGVLAASGGAPAASDRVLAASDRAPAASGGAPAASDRAAAAYLIYPHLPIVAYLPQTGALLSEYCVAFPDHTRPYGSAAPARLR